MIQVQERQGRYVALATFAQKDVVKAAGFRWDPTRREWWTASKATADALNDPDAAQKAIERKQAAERAKTESITASRAQDAPDIDIPCPDGLAYLPFQRAGIAYANAHRNVLFGDDMGLGKTIQLIGLINSDDSLRRILLICPASLKLNWQRELGKWSIRPHKCLIAPSKPLTNDWAKMFDCVSGSGIEILIINYDILKNWVELLHSMEFDLVACDEAHYLKNPDAQRTKIVVGREETKKKEGKPSIRARRKAMLTGTPIPNRPVEGWPIFHYLDPVAFPKFWYYVQDYCGATQTRYGWDFTGATNLDRLQDKLRASIMVRRRKADVLTDLPPKTRQIVEVPLNGAAGAVAEESLAYERHEAEMEDLRVAAELAKASDNKADYTEAVARLRDAARAAFNELSDLRHRTAVAKVPHVIEHLRDCLGEEDRQIIVFAWHKDVIQAILDALKEDGVTAVSITGDTPMQARQDAVDAFQGHRARVFVGNIMAAGVGLTLTASSHVVFVELDWVPGNVTQAEDRCHRIGQHDNVLIQHIVLDGSLDSKMAKTLIAKQAVIDAALDRRSRREPPPLDTAALEKWKAEAEKPEDPISESPVVGRQEAATADTTRDQLAEIGKKLTAAQVDAIHRGLQILAGNDWDHAMEKNDIGFNRFDNRIGHSLANSPGLNPRQAAMGKILVNKYRRQLPADLVARAKGEQ